MFGCGGVGQCIVQGLRAAGAHPIVAVDVTEAALELARASGATDTVLAGSEDDRRAIRRATRGGADVAFEALGLPATIEAAYASLAGGGRAVIVGMPARDATITINAFSLAGQSLSLMGSLYGSSRPHFDVPRLVELEDAGLLSLGSLIARRYPLDEINGAYDDLRSGAPGRGVITFAYRSQSETIAATRGSTLPSSIHSRSVWSSPPTGPSPSTVGTPMWLVQEPSETPPAASSSAGWPWAASSCSVAAASSGARRMGGKPRSSLNAKTTPSWWPDGADAAERVVEVEVVARAHVDHSPGLGRHRVLDLARVQLGRHRRHARAGRGAARPRSAAARAPARAAPSAPRRARCPRAPARRAR